MITFLKRFWNYLRVQSAIKSANKLNKLTNKKYYVIKVFNKIRVYDRLHINYLISEGILSPRLRNSYELHKIALYFTK